MIMIIITERQVHRFSFILLFRSLLSGWISERIITTD